jgi:adenylylsulfate kinase
MAENLHWHEHTVSRAAKEKLFKQSGKVLWFTGLSASGKSTIANATEHALHQLGYKTMVLDGDNIRMGLCKDLGFSDEARKENIRRIAEVAKLFAESGTIVLTAFISPFRSDRDAAREIIGEDFIEIFVDTPIEICEQRDPKGLYKKARAGQIKGFTGIDSPYEAPLKPEIKLNTELISIQDAAAGVAQFYISMFADKEISNLDKRKTIAIDFDGVIHKYSQGFKGLDNAYDEPMEGTFKALAKLKSLGYTLKIMSSRPAPVIEEWLFLHGLEGLISEVSNYKFPASIYIDDRGFKFESWDQLDEILNTLNKSK